MKRWRVILLNFKVIGDIHIGKKDARILRNEIYDGFIKEVEESIKNDKLDAIFIAGDYFDRVIRMNETAGVLAIELMSDLINLCEDKKVQLRIIKGTKTHDYNQLNVFSQLQYDNPDILKIYNTVGTENMVLSNGEEYKVLYLPEEYPSDFKEFYGDLLLEVDDNEYDIIIGHGMIDFVTFVPQDDDSENPVKSAPIFDSKELMRVCKGPIIFGHIHDYKIHKDKIFYTGSYSRYSFADTEDKGYFNFSYDKDNDSKFTYEFVENKNVPTYVTIDVDDYKDATEEKFIDIVNELKTQYDYVRFISKDSASVDLVRKLSEQDTNVKVMLKNNKIKEIKIDEKYRFILEKKYGVAETIKKFIELKEDYDIDLKRVEEIIKPQDI